MLKVIKKLFVEGRTLAAFTFIKALGQGLGMIAPLVIAKFFEPELFASFTLARMIVFFFVSLLIDSTIAGFIVFANQEKQSSGKINKSFTVECVFVALSFCLFTILVLPFSGYVIKFAKISYGDLLFVALAFLGMGLKSFACGLFLAMGRRVKKTPWQNLYSAF